MGRGVKGRGRQDKTDWRQVALQPSLHIPFTRVACEVVRVAEVIQNVETVGECMAPIGGDAEREPGKPAS